MDPLCTSTILELNRNIEGIRRELFLEADERSCCPGRIDSLPMYVPRFAGLVLAARMPEETILCKLRDKLKDHELDFRIFDLISQHLQNQGSCQSLERKSCPFPVIGGHSWLFQGTVIRAEQ